MNQLQVIAHDNRRVLTTNQLAESYGTDSKQISYNFNYNKDRYTKGKHFVALEGEEKREFINRHEIKDGSKNAKTLYLWTEKGAWLHAKSLNTDAAWDAYEMLVDEYYNIQEHLTAEQQLRKQLELSLMTSERVDRVEEKVEVLVNSMRIDGAQEFALNSQGKAKVLEVLGGYDSAAYNAISKKVFAQLWRDFKNYFKLPRYSELPKSKFDEGVYFISKWRPTTAIEIEIEYINKQGHLKLVQ